VVVEEVANFFFHSINIRPQIQVLAQKKPTQKRYIIQSPATTQNFTNGFVVRF
jgi:hypothetical protein